MTYTARESSLIPGAWLVTDGRVTIAECYHDRAESSARALARLLAVSDAVRRVYQIVADEPVGVELGEDEREFAPFVGYIAGAI